MQKKTQESKTRDNGKRFFRRNFVGVENTGICSVFARKLLFFLFYVV